MRASKVKSSESIGRLELYTRLQRRRHKNEDSCKTTLRRNQLVALKCIDRQTLTSPICDLSDFDLADYKVGSAR
jgi:hypothetical protein